MSHSIGFSTAFQLSVAPRNDYLLTKLRFKPFPCSDQARRDPR